MREAPSIYVADMLIEAGATVKGYDPIAIDKGTAQRVIKGIEFCGDAYEAASGVDALVVLTEWNEFKQLDMIRVMDLMKQPIVVDGRNIYDPELMKEMGFTYRGFGRGYNGAARIEA